MGEIKSKPATARQASALPQEERQCAGHALGFPLRSELGFLPIENITLDVFRCVCDIYATTSAQPWEIAMRIADEQLGPAEGPLLVARVTAFLRALRAERKIGFSYLSISCQHVSPDELTVTALLKSARGNDARGIERGIALVLENAKATERTRFSMHSLAAMQSRHVQADAEKDSGAPGLENQTVRAVYLH